MKMDILAGAALEIDLSALLDNYRLIQRQVAPATCAAVVKADAYGLGATQVVSILKAAGCRHFFVAHLREAAALAGLLDPADRIFVLNGLQPGAEAACLAIGAVPVLNSLDQIERWNALGKAREAKLAAALQFDTGMARLGLSPSEVTQLVAQPERLSHVDLVLQMSHLACSDQPDAGANLQQVAAFQAICAAFPSVPRSLDNSGGCFLERTHFDLVRPGIALFGGAPRTGVNPMKPVVSLEARIIQVRDVPEGGRVGYGQTHLCLRSSRIATIGVGYADGWPRCLGAKGSVFIQGIRAPIAGRVSMDSITVDVTDVPDRYLYPGALVELLGPNQTIDDVADDAGTIAYELLTQLGARYHREYRHPRGGDMGSMTE